MSSPSPLPLSPPHHTGSIDTLWNIPKEKGVEVREELIRFHKEHYSANLVTITVLGRCVILGLNGASSRRRPC